MLWQKPGRRSHRPEVPISSQALSSSVLAAWAPHHKVPSTFETILCFTRLGLPPATSQGNSSVQGARVIRPGPPVSPLSMSSESAAQSLNPTFCHVTRHNHGHSIPHFQSLKSGQGILGGHLEFGSQHPSFPGPPQAPHYPWGSPWDSPCPLDSPHTQGPH